MTIQRFLARSALSMRALSSSIAPTSWATPPVGRPRSSATDTVWRTRVPPPTPTIILCLPRASPSSSAMGRSASLPRSKMDWPPMPTSTTSGRISNSRSLWVLAITRRSTSDSRMSGDLMWVLPSPFSNSLMNLSFFGLGLVRLPEAHHSADDVIADVSGSRAEGAVHGERRQQHGVGDLGRLHREHDDEDG